MKSTWFSKTSHYEFAKCLQAADYSLHSWDLMHSWLTMTVCSFRQAVRRAMFLDICPKIEDQYMQTVSRLKHPEKMPECLSILVNSLEKEKEDFLGSTISELGQNDSKWRGQCFTPFELCRLMAKMTFGDMKPSGKRIRIQEPACGGGAMVIASSLVLAENGFFPWHYYWDCIDIDWRMYASTYIQLTLLGIPSTVHHGNTLSLEIHESSPTLVAALHPYRETCPQRLYQR